MTLALLIACTVAFALRVLGQVLVVTIAPRWLPPMEGWQSGILPYPVLLASQIGILALQVAVIRDVAAGGTATAGLDPVVAGRVLIGLAIVYAAGMAYRAWRRSRREWPHWWSHGTIPIVFHFVLATFLATWGVVALG